MQALEFAIQRLLHQFPTSAQRIHAAAEIVRQGGRVLPRHVIGESATHETLQIGQEFWTCSCPDFLRRGVPCKHIFAQMLCAAMVAPARPAPRPEHCHTQAALMDLRAAVVAFAAGRTTLSDLIAAAERD